LAGNSKKFVVKNGLSTQNVEFVSNDSDTIITAEIANNSLGFTGSTGSLLTLIDSTEGVVFSINGANSEPILEAESDGTLRLVESTGKVLIGLSETADETNLVQVAGGISANNVTITGALSANGSIGTSGQTLRSDGTKAYWSTEVGYTGSAGFTGSRGDTGFTGSIGFTGSKGDTGFAGSQGQQGFAGSQGIQGIQGFTGSQGIQGFTGSKGEQGTSITIIGSVEDVNATNDPQALLNAEFPSAVIGNGVIDVETGELWIYDGTTWNDVGTIVGPQGATGFTGSQGAVGFTGSLGAAGFTGSAGTSVIWQRITANYAASVNDALIADTTNGGFTVTLPAAPSVGNYIAITDGGDWLVNSLTVARNGSTIEGSANDLILDVRDTKVEFVYDGSTWQVYSSVGRRGETGFTGSQGSIGFTGSTGSNSILVNDDTSTDAIRYPIFTNTTSGSISGGDVASTKLYFNPASGTFNATEFNSLSDIVLKENLKKIENALETITNIDGFEFNWKITGKKSFGVVAQELETVLPDLVMSDKYKTVNYNALIPFLIEAIKELNRKIDNNGNITK
jgi:hypothetical protein